MTHWTRRHWLQAVAACAVLPHRVMAAPATLPFGFSLYGMKSLPLAEALHACSSIGYDCVELALMPGYPAEPRLLTTDARRDLRKRLGDAGLTVAGLMENLVEPVEDAKHRANLERLKAAADLGQALAPERPPVVETVLGGKPAQWDEVKGRMAERLRDWAELGAASRTIFAVKPHVGGALHTPEGATWLLRQVNSPWLKLAFDYSHFSLRGFSLDATSAALAPESRFMHIKDARGNAEKFEFLLPGESGTNYVELFKKVYAAGYRGPVVVEVSGQISNKAGYDAVDAARRSFELVAPALRKIST